ncbi:sulfotransferase family protein [Alloyangia pacifica]|uniref:sulfotransferase family protein n=1 Tax=Alloyangia pacifica TaxID=311180 RepID=UPI001CFD249B|nr:sulfotransferase [Alloyangia pacifica]
MSTHSLPSDPEPVSGRDLLPPAAYLIGAPKCGTTALGHYLAGHPGVSFSNPKEPHYFSHDLRGLCLCPDEATYRELFAPGDEARVAMEGSVWYFYSETAISEILKARPDAMFIVMLRNPVKMLASLHRQLIHALDESEEDFRKAWDLSDARAAGRSIPRSCRAPSTLVYKRTAAYGEMLSRLYARVPRERVLVLFQEDMRLDTPGVYRRALTFLGLKDDGRLDFPSINEAKRARSRLVRFVVSRARPARELVSRPIKRVLGVESLGLLKKVDALNTAKLAKVPVPPDLAEEIAETYAEDMLLLQELVGRDLAALGWPVPAPVLPKSAAGG